MSNFTLTAVLFAAAQVAIAKGKTLAQHASGAVEFGVAPDADSFVTAFNTYVSANAYTVSLASVKSLASKVKPTKAKGILPVVQAVAKHNTAFLKAAPLFAAYVLSTDGTEATLAILSGAKPRKPRQTDGTAVKGKGSRKSSYDIAVSCQERDGFTVSRTTGGKYILDGEQVQGHLSKALYTRFPDGKVSFALRHWGYKEPK